MTKAKQLIKFSLNGLNDKGLTSNSLLVIIFVIIIFGIVGTFQSVKTHADAGNSEIKSGIKGRCLDIHNNNSQPGALIDDFPCNSTWAQSWTDTLTNIKHGYYCLSVLSNKLQQEPVSIEKCNGSANQVWIPSMYGFYNPLSEKCLTEPDSMGTAAVVADTCQESKVSAQGWVYTGPKNDCALYKTKREKITCNAISEWQAWQQPGANHETLLNKYTEGAPYEEWCADFVSFIFKQSGYPFSGGEANGWDESNANNIQFMGFSKHDPHSYSPQPGDVAYFNYEGGHVEIVISGGNNPSFVYGNSAKDDPQTGNGQMAANTITKDGNLGELMYYLSPN